MICMLVVMSQQHRGLWVFFSFSLFFFPDERILYLFSPPKSPQANGQGVTGKGYFYKAECAVEGIWGLIQMVFQLFFFLTALKGLLKLPGEQIHIFIIPPAQHFRHIYIPESIIIHNIQHLIYDSCHIWYKTPSEAINQPLHVKLPFIL